MGTVSAILCLRPQSDSHVSDRYLQSRDVFLNRIAVAGIHVRVGTDLNRIVSVQSQSIHNPLALKSLAGSLRDCEIQRGCLLVSKELERLIGLIVRQPYIAIFLGHLNPLEELTSCFDASQS